MSCSERNTLSGQLAAKLQDIATCLLLCCTALLAFLLTGTWFIDVHQPVQPAPQCLKEREQGRLCDPGQGDGNTDQSPQRNVPVPNESKWSVVSRDPLMSSVKWLASLPGTSSVHVNKICFAYIQIWGMGGPLSVVNIFTQIWTSHVHSPLLQSSANFAGYSYVYVYVCVCVCFWCTCTHCITFKSSTSLHCMYIWVCLKMLG